MTLYLYDKPECPFCFKVRLGLHEQGRTFEQAPHDSEASKAARARLSRSGSVPILVLDQDRAITESAVIMEYLAETGPGLLPEDPWWRAQARMIHHYSDTRLGQAIRGAIFEQRDKPEAEWDRERIDACVAAWRNECLPYLADQLGDMAYFAGEYSMADAALTARFALAEAYGMPVPDQYPVLRDWFSRMKTRKSFAPSVPAGIPTN